MSSSIVKLNIGGHLYLTTAHTLTAHGENFFSRLFSTGLDAARDEQGYLFVDRDGEYFKPLLSFLRTGELVVPPTMSRRLLEKEALFYGLNLSDRGVSDPQSVSGGIRSDGIYLRRDEGFLGYYTFELDGERLHYRSLSRATHNDAVYTRPARFVRLQHPWVILYFGTRSRSSRAVATITERGLEVQWRYPVRKGHRRPIELLFYRSLEPMLNVLFSDEAYGCSDRISMRVYFEDLRRASVTLVVRDPNDRTKNCELVDAHWTMEWREDQCHVRIVGAALEVDLKAYGGFMIVTSITSSDAKYDFASHAVRVFCIVDTERDAEPDIQSDIIDVYQFLRSVPAEEEPFGSEASEDVLF